MMSRAVKTNKDSIRNASPARVLCTAIKTNLDGLEKQKERERDCLVSLCVNNRLLNQQTIIYVDIDILTNEVL